MGRVACVPWRGGGAWRSGAERVAAIGGRELDSREVVSGEGGAGGVEEEEEGRGLCVCLCRRREGEGEGGGRRSLKEGGKVCVHRRREKEG